MLLTGGTGFIGRHLVQRLHGGGHELLLATTKADGFSDRWNFPTVAFLDSHGGIDESKLRRFQPDALVHLAWAGIPNLNAAWSLANVAMTSRVFATALACGVRRIVGVGSCREYAVGGGSKTESDVPDEQQDVFGQAKTSIYRLLRASCLESGVEWRWARPFYVYGPGQRPDSLIPAAIAKAAAGIEMKVSSPSAAVDFVHVTDVSEALNLLATEPGPSGAFNVGSGRAYNVASVAVWVRRQFLGESAGTILESHDGKDAWWADINSLSDGYGWAPTINLANGITDMISRARS